MIKNGKKLKINLKHNYNITLGTINNNNPKSMYLIISAWGKPINVSDIDYGLVIKALNKKIKSKVFNNINPTLFNKNKTIIDLDMRQSGISYNKKSFMSCEITLFKLNDFKIQNKIIKDNIISLLDKLINEVFEESEYFEFTKTKK
jgi:hypothetical protein